MSDMSEIETLDWIQYLVALQYLELHSFRKVKSLGPLQFLVALRHLTLSGFTSLLWKCLNPLRNLELQSLVLCNLRVHTLDPIDALTSLKHLELSGLTLVHSLEFIENLVGLISLKISHCGLDSLSPLESLQVLKNIELIAVTEWDHYCGRSCTRVVDFEWIRSMKALENATFTFMNTSLLGPMIKLPALKDVTWKV